MDAHRFRFVSADTAREQADDRIDDIVIPNMYYRDDIGERWIDGDGDRLQAWGYLGPA